MTKTCEVCESCGTKRVLYARGLCSQCYMRAQRERRTEKRWKRVKPTVQTGCRLQGGCYG